MANVILKNLVKRFGSVTAVDHLNIEIRDREFAVLVGPSGCGKTTALRMIAGLETVTSGEIYIGDTLVNDMPTLGSRRWMTDAGEEREVDRRK